ncbi:hypothetical protein SESBI_22073 [Sesbania bispinosa]|nr:hypothetical protein SESBI_22073 [Sesbania bispinosa]
MIKKLLLWFFLLIYILTISAYGSTSTTEIEGSRTSKQQKEPKYIYGMIIESSKPSTQRTNLGLLHTVQHTKMSQKAKTVTGGATTVKGPHKEGKSSASTYSIKSSSLFMAALRNLIPGMLLVVVGRFF